MATDVYLGEPLETDQIRLIRLQPGAWKDPIVCDLYNTRHTSIDDEPVPYYTLSYVWGSPGGKRRDIILSGHPWKVTINLERALRYYRHHYPNGADLWADALCIDQTNVTERTHQVRLMGQIYSKCTKMIIYLGDRLEYSSEDKADNQQKPTSASRSDLGKKRCSAGLAIQLIRGLSSNSHLSDVQSLQSRENLEHILESLRRLLHAPFTPWWDRVWVVQEAALAPEIEIMQGRHAIPWNEFASAALYYKWHSTSCCSTYLADLPRDYVKVIEDFSNRVLAVHESRGGMQTMSLPTVLCTFRNRQASDPRDKVYALLSLTTSNMVPDYSVSAVDVFCAATMHCIISSRNLSILNNDLGRKWREDIPSWVPDWSSPGSPIVDTRAAIAARCYNTSPTFGPIPPEMSGRSLLVSLQRVAEVISVSSVMWGETNKIVQDTLVEWWWKSCRCDTGLIEAFWRLICGDIVNEATSGYHRRAVQTDESTFATWALTSTQSPYLAFQNLDTQARSEKFWAIIGEGTPSNTLSKEYVNSWRYIDRWESGWAQTFPSLRLFAADEHLHKAQESVSAFERSIEVATLYRRLVIFEQAKLDGTRKQWIGLGPSEAAVGDALYILEGAKTPFILRRHGFDQRIVGDCYVHGMMDDCAKEFVSGGIWDRAWLV